MTAVPDRFRGQTALVTGGGTGIGAGIARRFAEEGANVMVLGRTPASLQQTVEKIEQAGGTAKWTQCDVSKPSAALEAVALAADTWGGIDVLINNAANFARGHVLELDPAEWDRVIATSLSGAFYMAQAAGRHMVRLGRGAIVNISSVDGALGEPMIASYNTAKAGLYGLTRSLAMDLGPLGIRANSVSPGYVADTPMAAASGIEGEALEYMLTSWSRVPMQRMVTIGEVAATCAFLASDEASGINGEDVVIDGGMIRMLFAMDSVPGASRAEATQGAIAAVRAALTSQGTGATSRPPT